MRTTKEQLLAAEEAYNRSAETHGFPGIMLIPLEEALDAALALVPAADPVPVPLPRQLTKTMADAAEQAYDRDAESLGIRACSRSTLERALNAALSKAPREPELEPVVDAGLSRQEALELAQKTVDGWAASQPDRHRGIAGSTAHSMEERTTAVLRLAAFLTGSAGEV